jgi:hypothetical protein
MLRATNSKAWRPKSAKQPARFGMGPFCALLFNICLVTLPLAGATAYVFVTRDNLFTYAATDANARDVRTRVEKLAGSLIMLDFDRRRQWDDLVARELVANDVSAARGFLLSARNMLPPRDAAQLSSAIASGGGDAALEMAALELLTPGTRSRYEATVPLLSRRSASGVEAHRADDVAALGNSGNFEILAAAMLDDPQADQLHFTLLGLRLGLGGDGFTARMADGAAVLNQAAGDMPSALRGDFVDLVSSALPLETFRTQAAARAEGGANAASYPIAAAAYRAALDSNRAAALRNALDEIGGMSEATSPDGAVYLLLHARSLRDLPRLRMLSQAAGDRAVAAAKRLERDGRLARVAQGKLAFTRDLMLALLVAGLALAGLAALAGAAAYQSIRRAFENLRPRIVEEDSDLVRSFETPWRVL